MDVSILDIIIYLLVGAAAGLLSGLFGIGGGSIIVPVLLFVYAHQGMPAHSLMHLAAGTSLMAMIFTTTLATYAQWKRGVEIWPVYRLLLIGLILGTMIGGVLADFLMSDTLRLIFGIFVLFLSLKMLVAYQSPPHRHLPKFKGMTIAGGVIGLISGLLGIGGGAITVPFLSYCNVRMQKAVAVSAACGMSIAVVGAITYMLTGTKETQALSWNTGYVYWPAVICIVIGSVTCVYLGVFLSHSLPVKVLKRLFGLFLLLVAMKMLIH